MDKTGLCISFLSGEWTAASFRKDSRAATWQRPSPVEDFAALPSVVAETLTNTRPESKLVRLVLAHARLSDQLSEVPPIRGWNLDRFLQRRIEQLKTFEGEAAWSYQRAMPTKNSDAVLLHVMPRALLDQLTQGCDKSGLQLVRVLPTTSVLAAQLKELPLEKDEVALLAAQTGPTTSVVIGRRDGRVCLGRVLAGTWNSMATRVAVDLTRTIGFAEQQTGLTVASVWLFGPGAQERLPEMQGLLKLPVKASPVEWTPGYWAEQAARLPEKEDGNLITPEQRAAPQRRKLLTVTGLVLLVWLIVALVTALVLGLVRGKELKTIERQTADMVRLQGQKTEWEQKHRELDRKARFIQKVMDEKPAPVPAWFLGYLSEAVPDDLLLTQAEVKSTNDVWSVRLAGVAQPTTNASPETIFNEALALLATNLATGPFHLQLKPVLEDEPRAAQRGKVGRTNELSFKFEGTIR
jgi:hypothetical protein